MKNFQTETLLSLRVSDSTPQTHYNFLFYLASNLLSRILTLQMFNLYAATLDDNTIIF